MRFLVLNLALALSLSAQTPAAADFYVSPAGNDSSAGTFAAPFATVNRARQAVQNLLKTKTTPITVLLRGGAYYLAAPVAFTGADSATAANRVTWQAYPGEIPVLSGAIRLNSFSTALPPSTQNFWQLFVNGQRRYRPRTTRNGYLRNAGSAAGGFKYNPGDLADSYANIADVDIINFEISSASRVRLKSIDPVNRVAAVAGTSAFTNNHRYIVENVKEALSQPGDWYLDRGASPWSFTYLPRPGEDILTAVVEVPQLPQILTAANLAYTTFSGITFAHDNTSDPTAAISVTGGNSVVFDGCTIAHTSGWGIAFSGGTNNQVVNSVLYDLGGGGIRLTNSAQNTLIQNNAITGGGRYFPGEPAISVDTAHHSIITHNEISDFYRSGIEDNSHDETISFNRIFQIGQSVNGEAAGVLLTDSKQTGNQILNNRIHDVTHATQENDAPGGWGIELDGASSVSLQNNLIYRTATASVFNKAGTGNSISNNILAYGAQGIVQNARPSTNNRSLQFTGNIAVFTNNVQRPNPSEWYCNDAAGVLVSCTSRFLFDSNQYFNPASAPLQFYLNPDPLQSSRINTLTLAQWQAANEDVKSQTGNPLLANPTYPADDFKPAASTPAAALNFVTFDPAQAGRTNALLYATPLDPAWPARQLDPVTDYKQLATQAAAATTVNSASFRGGSFSANSIAALFGTALATATVVAPSSVLPLAMNGTSVTVRDSLGVTRPAELYFVSAGQLNYVIPPGTASGNAAVTVITPGSVASSNITISGANPGLYAADGSGRGTAAAGITYVHADGASDFSVASAGPIDLSREGDQVFCTLYGTGIRNRTSLSNVSVQLGGISIPALYAGAQPSYEGFDQVNFQIPRSLAGRGTLTLTLTVDNATSNSVTLSFR